MTEIIESQLNPQDEQFQQNVAHNQALAEELRTRLAQARRGGSEKSHQRPAEQG